MLIDPLRPFREERRSCTSKHEERREISVPAIVTCRGLCPYSGEFTSVCVLLIISVFFIHKRRVVSCIVD